MSPGKKTQGSGRVHICFGSVLEKVVQDPPRSTPTPPPPIFFITSCCYKKEPVLINMNGTPWRATCCAESKLLCTTAPNLFVVKEREIATEMHLSANRKLPPFLNPAWPG
jgi:hypothetical protein